MVGEYDDFYVQISRNRKRDQSIKKLVFSKIPRRAQKPATTSQILLSSADKSENIINHINDFYAQSKYNPPIYIYINIPEKI